MHEWALADAVIEEVKKYVDPAKGQRVKRVVLLFGELQAVDREVFAQGLADLLRTDPMAESMPPDAFTIETEPATFRCRSCRHGWPLASVEGLSEDTRESIHFVPETVHAFVSCPACSSSDFEIEDGRGVTIKSIDLVELVQ